MSGQAAKAKDVRNVVVSGQSAMAKMSGLAAVRRWALRPSAAVSAKWYWLTRDDVKLSERHRCARLRVKDAKVRLGRSKCGFIRRTERQPTSKLYIGSRIVAHIGSIRLLTDFMIDDTGALRTSAVHLARIKLTKIVGSDTNSYGRLSDLHLGDATSKSEGAQIDMACIRQTQ